jgi:hypothetical protein
VRRAIRGDIHLNELQIYRHQSLHEVVDTAVCFSLSTKK